MAGGGGGKRRPAAEPKPELVEVKRVINRVGKPPRTITIKVPKDHPLAKGS